MPDDATLASVLGRKESLPSSCVSSLEPWRAQIANWHAAGVQGTTIHATLVRTTATPVAVLRCTASCSSSSSRKRRTCRFGRNSNQPRRCRSTSVSVHPITDVHTGEIYKTWFFVMTLCWPRHQYAEFVRDQSVATWLDCHRRAFEWFGGVVERVTIDNAKCAIARACVYEPEVQRSYGECAEGYGFGIDACLPRDPQKIEVVEAGVKYIKGRLLSPREFRDLSDACRSG
jgi:transposase